ncbi:MAG: hypothetical protein ACD_20C00152G0005 [uncultured bacterium]|nr:MAG: hypothetical protein ACD_20C00152G0005 [uncultured bacterium]
MKRQLLAVALVSLLAIGITGKAKAADNADSVLSGTMSSTYAVTAIDGAGTIAPTDGAWSTTTNPSFTVVSNNSNYKVRISALAGNSGASQALGVPATPALGNVRLAVAKTAATTAAVADAIVTATATPAANINVIAYDIAFAGTGVVFDTFVSTPLVGTVSPTGSTTITGTVGTLGNGTFSTSTDTSGTYTATIHLVASDT